MSMTAGDILIERLIGWGVHTIFGFPGDGVNGIFESLRTRKDRIRFVQVRHEEAAPFAACGDAKFGGGLGVCIATSGPGGIHLLNGLYDAKCDGIPVLAITGHTFHDLIGTHYQQDVDLTKLYQDVAVYNERITGPAHVANALDEAIRTAMARRGVAHLCFPKDVQEWQVGDDARTAANVKNHSMEGYAPPALLPARSLLESAAEFAAVARGCGLAGFSVDDPAKVDEQRLLPAVRKADDQTLVVADGFSCKRQIEQGTSRPALHGSSDSARLAASEPGADRRHPPDAVGPTVADHGGAARRRGAGRRPRVVEPDSSPADVKLGGLR